MKIDRKWLGAAVAAVAGLGALSLVPAASQAQNDAPAEKLYRCVNGPGLDTHVLDEKTLLAQDSGRGGVLIKVNGCRLNPYDILVFEYRGTQQICDPLDVQLSLRMAGAGNFKTPCFIESVTPVGKDQAKALSKQKFQRHADRS